MAIFHYNGARLHMEGEEVSPEYNSIELAYNCEQLDKTVFNDADRSRFPGLLDHTLTVSGFYESSLAKDFNRVTTTDLTYVLGPEGSSQNGDRVFFSEVTQTEYVAPQGTIGDLAQHNVAYQGQNALIRGQTLTHQTATESTVTTVDLSLGSVTATESLYGCLQIIDATGGAGRDFALAIVSDNSTTFGTETTRISFTTTDSTGAEFASVAGSITDTVYRGVITVTTTGAASFQFLCALGIK